MPDDPPSDGGSAAQRASSSGFNVAAGAPPGHAIRRAFTVDESRRRPSLTQQLSSSSGDVPPRGLPRRRSSNFTDYSLGEARDILNPKARDDGSDFIEPESSSLASLSLAFALLPALAGVLFKNGGAFVTDLMLLGLSGVFLHWSVTQPWNWYHSAQEIRVKHEASVESAIDEDNDPECFPPASPSTHPGPKLDNVPEEESEGSRRTGDEETNKEGTGLPSVKEEKKSASPRTVTAEQRSAIRELYLYEAIALLACFALPLLAAYLLHTIRDQLSRPSEGLVSNYNLTIFCMASELRVFSHMFKLVQSRTLHLQRIVHTDPYMTSSAVSARQLNEMAERLERLENPGAQARTGEMLTSDQQGDGAAADSARWKQEAAMIQQVRNGIQPDLDALKRAVRRYEKKATLLQLQVESRFGAVDARLDDSIALATAAANNSAPRKSLFVSIMDMAIGTVLSPFRAALHILLLPVKTVSGLLYSRRGRRASPAASPRPGPAGGRSSNQSRYSGDRVPGRVGRR